MVQCDAESVSLRVTLLITMDTSTKHKKYIINLMETYNILVIKSKLCLNLSILFYLVIIEQLIAKFIRYKTLC